MVLKMLRLDVVLLLNACVEEKSCFRCSCSEVVQRLRSGAGGDGDQARRLKVGWVLVARKTS